MTNDEFPNDENKSTVKVAVRNYHIGISDFFHHLLFVIQFCLTGFAQRLDEDGFCEFLAECDARVADLTDQTRMAADESDALLLAQTHFAKAIHHVGLYGKLFDADRRARLDG